MPNEGERKLSTKGQQYVMLEEVANVPSLERRAFVQGLFNELDDQLHRYLQLNGQLLDLQARMTIVERNLRLTREHLKIVLSRTDEEVPANWQETLQRVRFVGARQGDACVQVLREKGVPLTIGQIIDELNNGQFRFRTGTPLREVNAALLRQPNVKREDDHWVYEGPATEREDLV